MARNHKPFIKYSNVYLPAIQRKALYTSLDLLVDVKLSDEIKRGGSHAVAELNDEIPVDINAILEVDQTTLYKIIASEFHPYGLVSNINRFICLANQVSIQDINQFVSEWCKHKPKVSNKSCILINEHLAADLSIVIPMAEPKTILDIGGNKQSLDELTAVYPGAKIKNITYSEINSLNSSYDLVICSQYLHHLSFDDINKLVDALPKITNDLVFVREMDVTNSKLADLLHDLHAVLIDGKTQRNKINYMTKNNVLELFGKHYKLVSESQHDSKDNPLSLYSIALELNTTD